MKTVKFVLDASYPYWFISRNYEHIFLRKYADIFNINESEVKEKEMWVTVSENKIKDSLPIKVITDYYDNFGVTKYIPATLSGIRRLILANTNKAGVCWILFEIEE